MTERPRSAGFTYALLTMALLVLLATIALTARQPPPPAIAEFAPQAVENISDSPDDQSSADRVGAALPAPTPTLDPVIAGRAQINVPRVRKCVGDPPRQIEDPQSPPCVPYWTGDNGGATSKGVTRNEVRVATASAVGASGSDTNSSTNVSRQTIDILAAFFNRRFEFYGRRLNLIIPGTSGNADPEPAQRAYAVAADEQYNVFASTAYRNAGGQYYHEELARRGVVSAMGYEVTLTEPELAAHQPHLWSYVRTSDRMFADIGDWICARLAGTNAIHADPIYRAQRRRFGVIMAPHPQHRYSRRPPITPLRQSLGQCGESPAYVANVDPGPASYYPTDPTTAQAHQDTMIKMRQSGVNSIICLCDWQYLEDGGLNAASAQSYYPEWLVSTFGNMDHNITIKLAGSNQPQHLNNMFGLSFNPRQIAIADEPYVQALGEIDPALATSAQDQHVLRTYANQELYRSLLLIASGIQMAGPNLTPKSFERALHGTNFPNPQTFHRAGNVGFDGGSHAMTLDAAEWWWGPTARSPYPGDSIGSMCYVDGGKRRTSGRWPQGDVFFSGTCDAGAG